MIVQEAKDIDQLLEGCGRILITSKIDPGFDEVSSVLAWANWLKGKQKERVDVVLKLANPNRFKFMAGFHEIRDHVQIADHFIIRIDISKTKVQELSYDVKGDALEVKLKPQDGNFTPKDISFAESQFAYDAVIVLGASDLQSLGEIYEQNRELLYHVPIVNIDLHSSNERFGKINAVYLTATSLAEISYEIMHRQVSHEVATCLLTGLIAATNSFQTPQVTPDTLRLASELIVAGAKREEIVEHLYRTKDMDKLRVWGQILARLQRMDGHTVYSHLTEDEIKGKDLDLAGLVDDLVLASPEADLVLFVLEGRLESTVYAYGRDNYDMLLLFQKYQPKGNRKQVTFSIAQHGQEAEAELLDHIRQQMKFLRR